MIKQVCIVLLVSVVVCSAGYAASENEILFQTPRLHSVDDLLNSVIDECFEAPSTSKCMKGKVLNFLDTSLGVRAESARAFEDNNIDKVIFDRVERVLNANEFKIRLPEFLFQNAEVSYRADRGFDIDFPEEHNSATGEARGILKKKLLLPVLLLLKLKMKALMPIFVGLIGIKAIKALILSKLAITLVLGFLIYNLVMKKGAMPMMMAPAEPPAPIYGAPPPAAAYGAPSSTPAAPSDSYSPQWDPSSSGPYARVWDPSVSSSLAYSSYYPSSSGSSSSSSNYPSISSSSSVSSSSSATY